MMGMPCYKVNSGHLQMSQYMMPAHLVPQIYCSDAIPCTNENEYCNTPQKGVRGIGCFQCPDDPLDCYFENDKGGQGKDVASCSSQCAPSIEFGQSCKTCGDTITGFEFGVGKFFIPCSACNDVSILTLQLVKMIPLIDVNSALKMI